MEKQLIASRFTKSLKSYDSEAVVQQYIARKMCHKLEGLFRKDHLSIAEFGCGTGFYTKLICDSFSPTRLWLNDLCEQAGELVTINGNTILEFEPGDMEKTDLPVNCDLITGCSVIQWFSNPEIFFKRCLYSLKPEGILAFSSFGKHNFKEIRDLTGVGLNYSDKEDYKRMLGDGFEILCCKEESVVSRFESPTDVLKHIKKTGVSGTGSYRWTKDSLKKFQERYVSIYGTDEGVSLTYNPIYIIARKK